MILVTGATGHLGNVLIRTLVVKGKKIKALVLPNEDPKSLVGLDVEIIKGDVRDTEAMRKACKNVDLVYHLAAVISIAGNSKLVYDVNVGGTKNILQACKENHVPRLVYVSSVHAFAELRKGSLIDENVPIDPSLVTGHYAKSKAIATNEVFKSAKDGYDAVVVFPSGIVGPYDWKISEMGSLIIHLCRGTLKTGVEGGFDFVDVRDVVNGILKVSEKASRGEKYILSGEYTTVRAIIQMMSKILGRNPVSILLPSFIAYPASVLTVLWSKLSGSRALLTPYSVFTLNRGYIYSHQKAYEELGYMPRPIFESLKDAVNWFLQNGYIQQKTSSFVLSNS